MAIADFEEFFEPSANFKVNFAFRNINQFATVSGNKDKSTILINNFSSSEKIKSLQDVMMCLIVIGHELAHYINRHNSHVDKTKADSVAIEGWADYFGARITFTLITYGVRITNLIEQLTAIPFSKPAPFAWRQNMVLSAMGQALIRAFDTLYKPGDGSGRYLTSDLRTYSFLGGVTSFFYRAYGELDENLLVPILKKLSIDSKLADHVYDPREGFVDQEHFDRTRNIHLEIQGKGQPSITGGLKLNYRNLLGTSYVDSPVQRMISKKRIENQLRAWKFKVDIDTFG